MTTIIEAKDSARDNLLKPDWSGSKRDAFRTIYCVNHNEVKHPEVEPGKRKYQMTAKIEGGRLIGNCSVCGRIDDLAMKLGLELPKGKVATDEPVEPVIAEPISTIPPGCPPDARSGDSSHFEQSVEDSDTPEVEEAVIPPRKEPVEPVNVKGREPGSDDEPSAIPPVETVKDAPRFKLPAFFGCAEDELNNAKLHPKCIVENLYYADVGALFAPGGVGKTTLKLYESICIALGRDLWGYPVINPGKTIIMTAEDSRDLILARMREMMNAMRLTPIERNIVMSHVMIIDVSGDIQRLAESDTANNLVITSLADSIVEQYQHDHIAQFIFDPAIRFGPGERYINDGEDMIIIACRRIVRGLNCLVQIIHHTGKQNARNGSLDQYSGRGGSAFSDGCRMVTVLSNNGEMKNPPEGFELLPGDSGFVMARPKLSYCKPQPNIWIRRHGWNFEHFIEEVQSGDEILEKNMERLAIFVREEMHHGRKYTKRNLDAKLGELKMSRQELRSALSALEVCGRMVEKDLPEDERQGGRKSFLFVLTAPENLAQ